MNKHVKSEDRIFSPAVTNWILALTVGLLLPFFTQNVIATAISNLSSAPILIDGQIQETSGQEMGLAGIILIVATIIYFIFTAYQIRFIALLKTHTSVFAFVVTVLGPFIIWIGLPFVLQAFNSQV
jgi:hypothetical protein